MELQKEARTIDLDAVLDIAYKDRFSETGEALQVALDDLYTECGNNAVYLKAYETAIIQESKKEISSLSEVNSFEDVDTAIKIFPELLTKAAEDYKKHINDFSERASKAKSIFELLKSESPKECYNILKEAIASKCNIPISIFSEKDYDSFETVSIENENLTFIKEAMMEVALDDSIPSEELQPLFDLIAEKSSIERLVIDAFRREKEQERMALVIAKEKEQKDKKSSAGLVENNASMKKLSSKEPTVQEAWLGSAGCGCLSVIIGCLSPVVWPYLIAFLIISLIYSIVITFRTAIQKKDNLSEAISVDQQKNAIMPKAQPAAPKKSSAGKIFTIVFLLIAVFVGLCYLGHVQEEEKAEVACKRIQIEQEKRDVERQQAIESEAKHQTEEERRCLELSEAKLAEVRARAEKDLERASLEAEAKRRAEEERRRLKLNEAKLASENALRTRLEAEAQARSKAAEDLERVRLATEAQTQARAAERQRVRLEAELSAAKASRTRLENQARLNAQNLARAEEACVRARLAAEAHVRSREEEIERARLEAKNALQTRSEFEARAKASAVETLERALLEDKARSRASVETHERIRLEAEKALRASLEAEAKARAKVEDLESAILEVERKNKAKADVHRGSSLPVE